MSAEGSTELPPPKFSAAEGWEKHSASADGSEVVLKKPNPQQGSGYDFIRVKSEQFDETPPPDSATPEPPAVFFEEDLIQPETADGSPAEIRQELPTTEETPEEPVVESNESQDSPEHKFTEYDLTAKALEIKEKLDSAVDKERRRRKRMQDDEPLDNYEAMVRRYLVNETSINGVELSDDDAHELWLLSQRSEERLVAIVGEFEKGERNKTPLPKEGGGPAENKAAKVSTPAEPSRPAGNTTKKKEDQFGSLAEGDDFMLDGVKYRISGFHDTPAGRVIDFETIEPGAQHRISEAHILAGVFEEQLRSKAFDWQKVEPEEWVPTPPQASPPQSLMEHIRGLDVGDGDEHEQARELGGPALHESVRLIGTDKENHFETTRARVGHIVRLMRQRTSQRAIAPYLMTRRLLDGISGIVEKGRNRGHNFVDDTLDSLIESIESEKEPSRLRRKLLGWAGAAGMLALSGFSVYALPEVPEQTTEQSPVVAKVNEYLVQ